MILQNTSFSSAYTTPLPLNISFSPKKATKFKDEVKLSSHKQDTQQLHSSTPDTDSDLVDLTLPEIPDLSSLSSLRDELRISRDQFDVSSNDPAFHLDLDESFLEPHGTLVKCPSLDTLSSSSIQFRHTGVLHTDSLKRDAEPLYFPQPDGRNSWRLFLPPRCLCSEEPSFSQARNSLTLATSDSGCRPASSSITHVRRSWRVGSSLPPGPFLGQEETNTQRYANEVLDRAFNGCNGGQANLVFSVSEKDKSSVLGCFRPNLSFNGPGPESSVPSQARIHLAMKTVKKKVHRILAKFSIRDTSATQSASDPSNSLRRSPTPGGIRQGRSVTQLCLLVCLRYFMHQNRIDIPSETSETESTIYPGF